MTPITRNVRDANGKVLANSRFLQVKALRVGPEENSENICDELDAKLIGASQLMQTLKKSIRTLATSAETVLILGESGTGKELIAHAIHDLSSRRSQPFLAVNCGALTESLLESELFGHVRGSFTGATANKKGFFEAAGTGTIFLDEFAEMSLATQSRLLRVLEERTIRPVGLTEPSEVPMSARVVVATNHDLRHDVSTGKFRLDLYYRINVLQIHAPALRDRLDDLLPLAQHFLRKYKEEHGCRISDHVSSSVLRHLKAYSWPGNVRELENIIYRLATTLGEEGVLSEHDLWSDPDLNHGRVQSLGHCQCRPRIELDRYTRLMDEVHGNVAEAARRMQIPRQTLQNRLTRLREQCGLSGA